MILTPVKFLRDLGAVTEEINLADAVEKVGAFVQATDDRALYLARKGNLNYVRRLSLKAAQKNFPSLVEIDAIECVIVPPIHDKTLREKFAHESTVRAARGLPTRSAHNVRALINPQAIGSIENKGDYRVIRLKEKFNQPDFTISTPLSVTKLVDFIYDQKPAPSA